MSRPERRIDAAGLVGVDLIQACGYIFVAVLGEVLGDGFGIELASRNTEALRELIGGLKEVVWQRDGSLHTTSIP